MFYMVCMHDMHLLNIDLNLITVLSALIELRSVSKAAKRLGLSQSATSHALARLRDALGDPLLVRFGRGVIPTPRAAQMGTMISAGLAQIEQGLFSLPQFDPSRETRTFRIISGDYAELLLVPPLAARLGMQAPQIDLAFAQGGLERLGTFEVDAVIGTADRNIERLSLRYARLFDDQFVSMVRKHHPLLRGRMTAARFAQERHAFVAPGGRPGGVVDTALEALQLQRRVAVSVPHFLVAPHIVATSDLVLTVGRRLAVAYATILPLTLFKTPVALPGFELGVFWHKRHDDDPAHRFLRETLQAVARAMPSSAPKH
jgi:DNA-binding transcriptional LysR family regulator